MNVIVMILLVIFDIALLTWEFTCQMEAKKRMDHDRKEAYRKVIRNGKKKKEDDYAET